MSDIARLGRDFQSSQANFSKLAVFSAEEHDHGVGKRVWNPKPKSYLAR
jgi:hypothetical protein